MSEYFNDKDYGDYFSQLEAQINGQTGHSGDATDLSRTSKAVESTRPEMTDGGVDKNDMARRKKRARIMRIRRRKLVRNTVAVVLLCCMIFSIFRLISAFAVSHPNKTSQAGETASGIADNDDSTAVQKITYSKYTAATAAPDETIESKYVVVIDLNSHTVVAARNADEKAFPASTTKVMTLLVAAEEITNLNDTFKMTAQITDPLFKAEATVAGFSAGEILTMNDLLYGTILPSGGDGAMGLAVKLAGSEEAFVSLMNAKAKELGLKNTHFTNTTGLYDDEHYTTVNDMAVILETAMSNELCRKILSTVRYTTSFTQQHPEGLELASTLFSYMYGDEPEGAQIEGGKTGYVNESGFCIAAFGHSDGGKQYLCVTFDAPSRWPAVFDQIALFSTYAK